MNAPPRDDVSIAPVPCEYRVEDFGSAPTGERAYRLTIHTPDTSLVTFWTQSALERFGRHLMEKAGAKPPPDLTIADVDDLRSLRDASPFEGH
jgi:hypothetical protein